MSSSFLSTLLYKIQPVKDAAINSVKFDSSGDYLFLAGQDRLIYLLNANNGKIFKTYEGHRREVLDIYVEKSNKRLASCGGDKTVFLWDIERGDSPRKYGGHTMRVNTVCMNQEGTLLLSGSYDTTVRIFDTRARQKSSVQVLDDAKDSISSVFINQFQIVSGSVDGYIRTYDIRTGQKIIDCIPEAVTCVSETSDNNCLLVSSLDNKIRLLDKSNGTLLNSFEGHINRQYRLRSCLDMNDEFVISGSEDNNVYVWNILENRPKSALQAHSNIVCSIAVSHDNLRMATSSVNGELVLWGN